MTTELEQQWSDALALWSISEWILAQAPTSPWVHPPALFAVAPDSTFADTPSRRIGLETLGPEGATVLDVGCGGGGSALPLASRTTHLHGVDEQHSMLVNFTEAAQRLGLVVSTTEGKWQDVEATVPPADLVISHHVAYNVADIGAYVSSLSSHANRRVIVELPDRHPTAPMSPLWKHFWDLDRPAEPSAQLFAEVVRASGFSPSLERFSRAPRKPQLDNDAYIAFVRTRLCLSPDRDNDVAEALQRFGLTESAHVATVHWSP